MKTITYQKGVSVVICCYNSSNRIKETLLALSKQMADSSIYYELVLVDNASTDDTSAVSKSFWKKQNCAIELRIVYEALPGLGNARRRGISEAQYSIILFCDDDNWLHPNYIQGVHDILNNNQAIAACGGIGLPVFETVQPRWFNEYAEAFATGSQEINSENNEVLNLYGAGLAVQRHALEHLYRAGFNPVFTDRVGKKLSSAGDTELTYALVLLGYKLHYSPELKFYHYMPGERLTQTYLKKLFKAFGTDGPVRNLYYSYISNRFLHKKIQNWNIHFLLSIFRMTKYFILPPKQYGRAIYMIWGKAYLKELFAIRHKYRNMAQNILRLKQTSKTVN